MNDVTILTAIEAHGERSTQTVSFVWDKNSLSGYCKVSSRLTSMAFYDTQNFRGDSQRNAQMLHAQGRAIAVEL